MIKVQERQTSGERVFAYEGNENGLDRRYYFQLQKGKWYLIRSEDLSN